MNEPIQLLAVSLVAVSGGVATICLVVNDRVFAFERRGGDCPLSNLDTDICVLTRVPTGQRKSIYDSFARNGSATRPCIR